MVNLTNGHLAPTAYEAAVGHHCSGISVQHINSAQVSYMQTEMAALYTF